MWVTSMSLASYEEAEAAGTRSLSPCHTAPRGVPSFHVCGDTTHGQPPSAPPSPLGPRCSRSPQGRERCGDTEHPVMVCTYHPPNMGTQRPIPPPPPRRRQVSPAFQTISPTRRAQLFFQEPTFVPHQCQAQRGNLFHRECTHPYFRRKLKLGS